MPSSSSSSAPSFFKPVPAPVAEIKPGADHFRSPPRRGIQTISATQYNSNINLAAPAASSGGCLVGDSKGSSATCGAGEVEKTKTDLMLVDDHSGSSLAAAVMMMPVKQQFTTASAAASTASAMSVLHGTILFPLRRTDDHDEQRRDSEEKEGIAAAVAKKIHLSPTEVRRRLTANSIFHVPLQQLRIDIPLHDFNPSAADASATAASTEEGNESLLCKNDRNKISGSFASKLRASLEEATKSFHWDGAQLVQLASAAGAASSSSSSSSVTPAAVLHSHFVKSFGDAHTKFLARARQQFSASFSSITAHQQQLSPSPMSSSCFFDGYFLECRDHPIWGSFIVLFYIEDRKPLVAIISYNKNFRSALTHYCSCVGVDVEFSGEAALLGIHPIEGMNPQQQQSSPTTTAPGFACCVIIFNFICQLHEVQRPSVAVANSKKDDDDDEDNDDDDDHHSDDDEHEEDGDHTVDNERDDSRNGAQERRRKTKKKKKRRESNLLGIAGSSTEGGEKYCGVIERVISHPESALNTSVGHASFSATTLRDRFLFPSLSIVSGSVFHGSVMRQASVVERLQVQQHHHHQQRSLVITIGSSAEHSSTSSGGGCGVASAVLLPHVLPFVCNSLLSSTSFSSSSSSLSSSVSAAAVGHFVLSAIPYLGESFASQLAKLRGINSNGAISAVAAPDNKASAAAAAAAAAAGASALGVIKATTAASASSSYLSGVPYSLSSNSTANLCAGSAEASDNGYASAPGGYFVVDRSEVFWGGGGAGIATSVSAEKIPIRPLLVEIGEVTIKKYDGASDNNISSGSSGFGNTIGGDGGGGAKVFHLGSMAHLSACDAVANDLRSGGRMQQQNKSSCCWLALSRLSCQEWLRDAVARAGDRESSADPAKRRIALDQRMDGRNARAGGEEAVAEEEEEEEENERVARQAHEDDANGRLLSADDRLDCQFLLRSLEVRAVRQGRRCGDDDEGGAGRRRRQRDISSSEQHRLQRQTKFIVAVGVDIVRIC